MGALFCSFRSMPRAGVPAETVKVRLLVDKPRLLNLAVMAKPTARLGARQDRGSGRLATEDKLSFSLAVSQVQKCPCNADCVMEGEGLFLGGLFCCRLSDPSTEYTGTWWQCFGVDPKISRRDLLAFLTPYVSGGLCTIVKLGSTCGTERCCTKLQECKSITETQCPRLILLAPQLDHSWNTLWFGSCSYKSCP
ncbi:hypothetical protein BD289DRAFT_81717 [Coniella lustricola]|uniref:Uncharacterized protein n=1 Tax=Coniella lustricola TaxID=2025994 RepID=A0A2T3AHE5_9PEZI|nr:hypothetical protein BD289DRAFT_81717 [Coniella lustricola]